MARLELGADGMVRFDGHIIAEIAYFDEEFADIIEAADDGFFLLDVVASSIPKDRLISQNINQALVKAGWWKS